MHNSESIHNKVSQLSVSTGNRLTSGYERVYETEIGYSILLTTRLTSGYERVYETEIGYSILLTTTSIQATVLVGYLPHTAPSPLPQIEKAAEHISNSPLVLVSKLISTFCYKSIVLIPK